jgi:hypothetical protein
MSGSEGGGEETTGRKASIGASPPTLRALGPDCLPARASLSSFAGPSTPAIETPACAREREPETARSAPLVDGPMRGTRPR